MKISPRGEKNQMELLTDDLWTYVEKFLTFQQLSHLVGVSSQRFHQKVWGFLIRVLPTFSNSVAAETFMSAYYRRFPWMTSKLHSIYVDPESIVVWEKYFLPLENLNRIAFSGDLLGINTLLQNLTTFQNLQRFRLSSCPLSDEGMAHLATMTRLTHIEITLFEKITENGVSHLQNLTGLRYLSLYSKDIKASGIAYLSRLTNMVYLTMPGSEHMNDACMVHINHLTRLEFLDLAYMPNLTSDGLHNLSSLYNLRQLSIAACRSLRDPCLALNAMRNLTKLTANGVTFTNEGLQHLSNNQELAYLEITDRACQFDWGLEVIGKLRKMEKLRLTCVELTDRVLAAFRNLTDLKMLHLRDCNQITKEGLDHLAGLVRLKNLDFARCQIDRSFTDAYEFVNGFTNLENFDLEEPSDCSLFHAPYLAPCTKLRSLKVATQAKISDLSTLQYLQLTTLSIEARVSAEELNYLQYSKCTSLTIIMEGETNFQDFQGLRNASLLRSLNLASCNLTDEDLVHLSLPNLTRLEIPRNPQITPAVLSWLVTLEHLTYLDVQATGITETQVRAVLRKLNRLYA